MAKASSLCCFVFAWKGVKSNGDVNLKGGRWERASDGAIYFTSRYVCTSISAYTRTEDSYEY
jgi:hypothetical protein